MKNGIKLLVFGQTGQVATALSACAERDPSVHVQTVGREEIDLSCEQAPALIEHSIRQSNCDVVVNAAAYTAVDKAESDEQTAWAVNAIAPDAMAKACADADKPFIHLSTDYVYDGKKSSPYVETDAPQPLSVYGASKAQGDALVTKANGKHIILRTSWVYSATGTGFLQTMLRLGRARHELNIVDDQKGAPTFAPDIAAAIMAIAKKIAPLEQGRLEQNLDASNAYGLFHMTATGKTSWYGFAKAIFEEAHIHGLPIPQKVNPITTDQYPTPARRPENSVLTCTKIARAYGVILPHWRESLTVCMAHISKCAPRLQQTKTPLSQERTVA